MLRNVTIDTSVGPLVGIAAENGVVYVNGTPHALTMYSPCTGTTSRHPCASSRYQAPSSESPTNTSHSPRRSPASPRR